jgi:hypothetical protein
MKDLSTIGEELFNKIRGRFPNVTIGDENGKVTNVPEEARFFDFAYSKMDPNNKVSVSIDEDSGLVVMYNSDLIALEGSNRKSSWYGFLRELRRFARKRLLNFDTRDIERSNLKKRDYKYLAKTPKDESMNESKMYGTARISYQDVGNARLMVRHTKPVNTELPTGRTMHIEGIYIESAEGERFKYPFKHMSGARAMARHVSEGGNAYDDFGGHITGLSEELAKLRKFKSYMGRSSVMAEGLSGYMDVVNERVSEVKSRINKLQRESYYKEAFEGFEKPMFEDVPEDVKQDWIAQLTIKQFNEELQDVFPYIYKLIGEAGPRELAADEMVSEDDPCWKDHKQVGMKEKNGKKVPNCVPEEEELERGIEEMMGQFAEHQISEKKDYNFTTDDIQKLQRNKDLKQAQEFAFKLVSSDSVRPMQKQKVNWFKQSIASKKSVMDLVKMMYDLLLSGEGKGVIGSGSDMGRSNYRKTFDSVEEADGVGNLYLKFRTQMTPGSSAEGSVPYLVGFAGFEQDPKDLKMKTATRKFLNLNNQKDIQNAVKKLMNDKVFVNAGKIILYREDSVVGQHPQLRDFFRWMKSYTGEAVGVERAPDREKIEKDPNGPLKKRAKKGSFASGDREVTAPDKKMTRYLTIDNARLLDMFKKQFPDFMRKYYKPAQKTFVMPDKVYKQFANTVNKPAIVQSYGTTKITVDQEKSFAEEPQMKAAKPNQIPLGEFILSYFDKETGRFPKGETAILTSIEKDYGESFINPAKKFIEQIHGKFAEHTNRPEINDVEQLGDSEIGEKAGEKSGEFDSYVDDDDGTEVTVHWEADEDMYGNSSITFYAVDATGNEVDFSPRDESRWEDDLRDQMSNDNDERGDYMYQQQKDNGLESSGYREEMASIAKLAGLK